jgi:hypothetical protein
MIGPDFVCIGAVKAGTQWLYDQVRSHPDCWMTPIKELHYFNQARVRAFPPANFLRAGDRARLRRRADPRALAFFSALRMCEGYGLEPDLYRSLFLPKGDKKSGDVSPGYCALDAATVEAVAHALPETKFLYIAREPVARAWSDISMTARQGKFDRKVLWCEAALRHYLTEKRMDDLSYSSRIVQRWASAFPPERFRVFFFDVTEADSDGQRREIFKWIGLDPDKHGRYAPDFNVKKGREKLTLTPQIRGWLESFYAAEREAFNRLLLTDFRAYCAPISLV